MQLAPDGYFTGLLKKGDSIVPLVPLNVPPQFARDANKLFHNFNKILRTDCYFGFESIPGIINIRVKFHKQHVICRKLRIGRVLTESVYQW